MSDVRPRLTEIILGKKQSRDMLIPANFGTGNEQQTIDIAKGLVANAPIPGPHVGMLQEKAANQDFSHNASDFGTLTWDSQRNEVTLDPVLCQIAGIESSMLGARLKDFLALVTEESRGVLADKLRRSLQTGKDLECACTIGSDPANAKEVRILGKTLPDANGRPASIVCAVQPKVALAPPHKKNHSPKAKAAHDLKNPLNAIRGYAQMLRKDPLTERQEDCLGKVENHCNAMLSTIESELGEQVPDTSASAGFSPFQMINDLAEMFTASHPLENVALTWTMQKINGLICTDQVKLRRILVNLVDNAIKNTQTGEIVVAGSIKDGNTFQVKVTDTGCGIPAEVMPRIFEPFFRLEQTGGHVGAGLGLAICRDLTKQLDGTIEADSEPGQGSEFTLTVPVSMVEDRRERDSRERPPSMVLIGDSSFHNRCISETLNQQGKSIVRFEALDDCETDLDAQLVMLDCSTNAAEGIAAISRVRARLPGCAIVAISDSLDGACADQLLGAGADTLLIKPFLARELIATIESAVQQATHRQPTSEVVIPSQMANSLTNAAARADTDGLTTLIDELESIDHSLAGELKEMNQKFDYDGLLNTVASKRSD
ncbi:MAG: ATP-binding protein [Lysobacterales bacterium]